MPRPIAPSRAFVGTFTAKPQSLRQCCPECFRPISYRDFHNTKRKAYNDTPKREQSAVAAAVTAAKQIFNGPPPAGPLGIDPLRSVAKEMKFMTGNIQQLLGSGHPMLDTVSKYYTQSEGKYVRPMLVLLMSQATSLLPKRSRTNSSVQSTIDTPISSSSVLNDVNPDTSPLSAASVEEAASDSSVLPTQRRLAEITELIHTASLLHDDVIDHSESRRGNTSANIEFGNKMAVLAGDFLLGRASVALARLRDPEVTELLATVIANLVEGEFMQLKNTALDERNPSWSEDTITYYLQKTYLKSASLISKSCRAAALLGEHPAEVVEAAYQYGKNLGLAFQLVDDMLDYTVSGSELGKPAGADLELGLATAPLLFAWKENKELGTLVGRKFSEEGDVQRARDIVIQSDGIEQTRALAQDYVDKAARAISSFPDSEAKVGLIDMIDTSTRLRRAILLNDVLLVERIVRNNPKLLQNPEFADKSNTSLHIAASHGFTEIAGLLIRYGHDEHEISRNSDHDTPLMLAAKSGHFEVGTFLAKTFPRCIPYSDKAGLDALAMAAQHPNSTALIPILLQDPDFPANPHVKDLDGNTPLHHASASGSLKALRILLAAGANPLAKNNYDWTPLAYSQTVAAEVYFKNLVAEFERRKQEGAKENAEREKMRAAGVRIVEDDGGMRTPGEADEDEVIGDALKRHWSPVERRRPGTPGSTRTHEWGSPPGLIGHVRTRSSSGD
ncbi:putative hexaprenyl pyrophosphate synthase, mitochondrial [Pseudocercospora fuligena]|uniref:Putative hexaprenyl pyrophosphate synthase, mitochondrial n=1 Tax=Pseudocercospora fuligena TaxID=685502 RepID=A0A8H6R5Q5_9PEZI|nr:putative hexaprenyl pyrophosphate synthase, mitochondrial [Pseudocercospora fuligena]